MIGAVRAHRVSIRHQLEAAIGALEARRYDQLATVLLRALLAARELQAGAGK